ncbi:Hypothetical predicted protein [Paramuricea clavata]|uniref:Uncharacterized protein n=1 Tax=Paramuricea clavata TaxID=317549 RepID=A0A6S7ICR3_PARCT|nr:Hypothetical predicted protein [Paramuricea clavata]
MAVVEEVFADKDGMQLTPKSKAKYLAFSPGKRMACEWGMNLQNRLKVFKIQEETGKDTNDDRRIETQPIGAAEKVKKCSLQFDDEAVGECSSPTEGAKKKPGVSNSITFVEGAVGVCSGIAGIKRKVNGAALSSGSTGTRKSTKDKQSKCFVCDLEFSKENKGTKQEWLFCDECNEWFHLYVLNFY